MINLYNKYFLHEKYQILMEVDCKLHHSRDNRNEGNND